MKLLLDANLSPRVLEALRAVGFDAVHVADLGLLTASDERIFEVAAAERFTVVTADSDFSMLLALHRTSSPSVVHLRHVAHLRPDQHAALLGDNLSQLAKALEQGAVVSLSPTRLAVRDLPIA